MSDGQMTYEDWLRGCVHHDGRNGYVTLPCDEVLKIADFIEKLRNADRKTEPQTEMEKSGSRAVQTARCLNCHNAKACKENHWEVCRYEPWKLTAVDDEPQTDCEKCCLIKGTDECKRSRKKNEGFGFCVSTDCSWR